MSRIGLHQFDTPDVELDGIVYEIVPATRSVTTKAQLLEDRTEDATADDLVTVYGELLDLRLRATEKGKPRPSTSLKRLWEAEGVSLQQIIRLLADIGQTDRPI